MGTEIDIFFLYKVTEGKHLLLRVKKPSYANYSQVEEVESEKELDQKRESLIERFFDQHKELKKNDFELIGEFQGLPEGDILYEEVGIIKLEKLWYVKTKYGHPWIFLSLAQDENDFWNITEEEDFADNGYKKEDLIPPAIQLKEVFFVTESFGV